jgi:phosphate-selective porin O/P
MKSLKRLGAALCVLAAGTLAADDNIVQIHGFGGWSYGKSSDSSYVTATPEGNAKSAQFALNVSARPYERLSVIAQVNFDNYNEETELDYAFAEWEATDHLKIRAGRVKHPLGLYGEVFDVGTVRPFQYLPQSLYGPLGFTAKAYNGAGITGTQRAGDWELLYDLYAGQIDGDYGLALPASPTAVPPANPNASPWQDIGFNYNDIIGGRLHVTTPVQGLMIGASGYKGKDDFVTSTTVRHVDRTVYIGSAEFARGPLTLRAEYGNAESKGLHTTKSKYVEGSYRIAEKWQLAARWDKLDLEVPGFASSFAGPMASTLYHEDIAVGVNYWFNANFVLRANYHMVEGNRLAYAPTNREMLANVIGGGLDEDTNALILGAQFSF